MRGARKLVPQPCHHDNASEFLPALAHRVKAFGVTLTRTGDVPDTGFSYLRALLIGATSLSLPPPWVRVVLYEVWFCHDRRFIHLWDKDPELLVIQKDCVSRFLTLPDSPVVYSTSLCSTSPPSRWVLSEHFDFLSILDLTVSVAS